MSTLPPSTPPPTSSNTTTPTVTIATVNPATNTSDDSLLLCFRVCFAQVKDRVYKNRIRIQDFFADFDKLRCGSITFHQVRPPTACAANASTL